MELTQAQTLANDLLVQHNLASKGWTFKFDRASRRFGSCSHEAKTISLSAPLAKLNDEERVKLTLLHEVAHALCSSGTGHSKLWKVTCRAIGGDGKTCYSSETVVQPKSPLLLVCSNCGHSHPAHRRSKTLKACPDCCKKYNRGKFSHDYLLHYVRNV